MKIKGDMFRGEVRRLGDQRLPEGFAQRALNARLLSGDLEAWNAPKFVQALTKYDPITESGCGDVDPGGGISFRPLFHFELGEHVDPNPVVSRPTIEVEFDPFKAVRNIFYDEQEQFVYTIPDPPVLARYEFDITENDSLLVGETPCHGEAFEVASNLRPSVTRIGGQSRVVTGEFLICPNAGFTTAFSFMPIYTDSPGLYEFDGPGLQQSINYSLDPSKTYTLFRLTQKVFEVAVKMNLSSGYSVELTENRGQFDEVTTEVMSGVGTVIPNRYNVVSLAALGGLFAADLELWINEDAVGFELAPTATAAYPGGAFPGNGQDLARVTVAGDIEVTPGPFLVEQLRGWHGRFNGFLSDMGVAIPNSSGYNKFNNPTEFGIPLPDDLDAYQGYWAEQRNPNTPDPPLPLEPAIAGNQPYSRPEKPYTDFADANLFGEGVVFGYTFGPETPELAFGTVLFTRKECPEGEEPADEGKGLYRDYLFTILSPIEVLFVLYGPTGNKVLEQRTGPSGQNPVKVRVDDDNPLEGVGHIYLKNLQPGGRPGHQAITYTLQMRAQILEVNECVDTE